MTVSDTEPIINRAQQRRATLRNRLGPPAGTEEALDASIRQLQRLARDRSEAEQIIGKQARRSRRA
jgi:hypothetical protein